MNRPYTTKELQAKLQEALNLKASNSYLTNIVRRTKTRKNANQHPLQAAYMARGMWNRRIVDEYFKNLTPEVENAIQEN